MFLLKEPADHFIQQFLNSQREIPFSYPEVGQSRLSAPAGYNIDHNRARLGKGEETFNRAMHALRRWKMFEMDWIKLCWPDAPVEVGSTVGVVAHHLSFWSLSACRIVYVLNEQQDQISKYGFAYGTLENHVEMGEERFIVEWHQDDDSVWYDLYAFSWPRHKLAKIGYPISRMLQKRFAEASKRAMVKAVNSYP